MNGLSRTQRWSGLPITLIAALLLAAPASTTRANEEAGAKALLEEKKSEKEHAWNPAQIAWQGHEKGLALAKEQNKPVCLVFFTEWCPHCSRYSQVFNDPKVVEQSRKFVMIRLDRDKNREVSQQYAPDGEYIPRTYFLTSGGKLDPEIHAPREKFQYFYDESDPGSLLAGMGAALKKLAPPPPPPKKD